MITSLPHVVNRFEQVNAKTLYPHGYCSSTDSYEVTASVIFTKLGKANKLINLIRHDSTNDVVSQRQLFYAYCTQ